MRPPSWTTHVEWTQGTSAVLENAMVTGITLKTGQSLKRQIIPVEVAFYAFEGTSVVETGEETQKVSKDTLLESPKYILHCRYKESDMPLKVMVIKAWRPTKKTGFVGNQSEGKQQADR